MKNLPSNMQTAKVRTCSINMYPVCLYDYEYEKTAVCVNFDLETKNKFLQGGCFEAEYVYYLGKRLGGWEEFENEVLNEIAELNGNQIRFDRKGIVKLLKDKSLKITFHYGEKELSISLADIDDDVSSTTIFLRPKKNDLKAFLIFGRENKEEIRKLINLITFNGKPVSCPK